MTTLLKFLVLVITLGLNVKRQSDDPKGRTPSQQLSNMLDAVFSLLFCAAVSILLGAFRVKPLESRGYDALGELMVVLMVLALKGVFFVVLPAVLLCMFLSRLEGLKGRLVIYGVFGLIGAGAWQLAERRAEQKARYSADREYAAERIRKESQHTELTVEQARAEAARREAVTLADNRKQMLELTGEAHRRWREDIESAGAIGDDGMIPDMLRVQVTGNWQFRITNNSPRRICLELFRVLKRGNTVYHRCEKDWNSGCREMAPLKTADFSMPPERNSPACSDGQLEFRIGTPLKPEPSWWSRSAIDDFDRHPPDLKGKFDRMDNFQLRSEIAILEKILAEQDRAARWRRELGGE
jgi:hypothetical protein